MSNIATTKYYATSSGSEKLEEIDEEEQLMWRTEHIHQRRRNGDYNHDDEEEDEENCIEEEDEDEEDDELMIEDASSMSSSPSIPDENINFDLVYALHTFVATVEGQASVVKGDALILMEDTNIYWWLVEVLKTREVGYIPAENIETPYERLARLNKHRNVEITSPSIHDIAPLPYNTQHPLHSTRRVTIGDETRLQVFHYEVESDIEEDEDEEMDGLDVHDDLNEEEKDEYNNEFHEITYDDDEEEVYNHNSSEQVEAAVVVAKEEVIAINEQQYQLEQESKVGFIDAEISEPIQKEEEEEQQQKMDLRVFAGNIGQGPLFHTFSIIVNTTADELIKIATNRFGVMDSIEPSENKTIEYYLAVQGMDGDEYILSAQDKPFSIFKTLTDSLTTPMPSLSHIRRISQQSMSSTLSTSSRRPRSSSFSNYEQTSYDEDSVIRFYLHRRIKRAIEREGLLYIKVSLYPDETVITTTIPSPAIRNDHIKNSSSAFIKNPTTPSIKLKKRRQQQQQQQQQQKSEIDRIDKIISVRKDYPIGVVINLALEKFHVPDAQADDYFTNNNNIGENSSRQLGKYRMSVRSNNNNNQETDLNPNEIMSNVLLEQQRSTPNSHSITSDLLFVLRKASSNNTIKQSQKQRHSTNNNNVNKSLPSQLLTTNTTNNTSMNGDRRPSILDILMDNGNSSTPKFNTMGERRPSVMSSLLDPLPPTRFAEDYNNNNNRRPSGQERKSSLNNININQQQQQQSPTSSSSSSFPSKLPSNIITGFNNRRSSIQSSSIISTSTSSITPTTTDDQRSSNIINNNNSNFEFMDNNNLTIEAVTPSSSTSIMTKSTQPSTSNSTETKKKESLKQQFKRFVGWGSSTSNSVSNKKSIPPPLTTTNMNSNSVMDSPSDISFVSAPSTPLPPTPGTPRSFMSKSRQGSQQLHGESKLIMEVNNASSTPSPTISRKTSESNTTNVVHDPSAAAIAAAAAIVNNKRLSTVSSVSTLSTSSVTSEEIAEANKKGIDMNNESEVDSDHEEPEVTIVKEKKEELISSVALPLQQQVEEPEDIQAQYALWMNSQPPTNPIPTSNTTAIISAPTTAIVNKALPPLETNTNNVVPVKNPLRNKSSNISNITNATISQCTTPSIISTTTTAATTIINSKEEPLHPMPTNNGGGQEDLDDLFLLVAHGVDFLTSRENTKWEEEGGYEFHPWNRPQSSFAVRQQEQEQKRNDKDMPPLPIHNATITNDDVKQEEEQENNDNSNNNNGSTSAALAMARSLLLSTTPEEQQEEPSIDSSKPISPPLTPLPQQQQIDEQQQQHIQQQQQQQEAHLSLAKRILSGKNEVPIVQQASPAQSQSQQSVDDEELQRIVASHIVF